MTETEKTREPSQEELLMQAKVADADTFLSSFSESDEALILQRARARQAERDAKAAGADADAAFKKRVSKMNNAQFDHYNSWGWDTLDDKNG
jgi:hypothetical protein